MNNSYVIPPDIELPFSSVSDSTSNLWRTNRVFDTQSSTKSFKAGVVKSVGIAIAISLSPLTSVVDPWISERLRYADPTTEISFEFSDIKKITLQEARDMALCLMAKMDMARIEEAEREVRIDFELTGDYL